LSAGGIVVGVAEGAPDGAYVGNGVKGAAVRLDESIHRLVSTLTTVLLDSCLSTLALCTERGARVGDSVGPLVISSELETSVTLKTGPKRETSTRLPLERSATKLLTPTGSTDAGIVTSRITEPGRTSNRKSEWEMPSEIAMLRFATAVSAGVQTSMDPSIASTRVVVSSLARVAEGVSEIGGLGSNSLLEGGMLGTASISVVGTGSV
jgi:hypothetical protein